MSEAAAPPQARPTGLAVLLLVIGFVLDQGTKLWVLHGTALPEGEVIRLAPVLDLVLTWNRGISYGLLQQDGDLGRWLLVGFSVAASVALGVWMLRSTNRLAALSLALIVSGALGNLVDRVVYGAVVDFVYFHVGSFSWYVFNLADTWIVAGVAGLLYDSFRPGHTDAAKNS